MCCKLCFGNSYCIYEFHEPDKYQGLINNASERQWHKCNDCGVYFQTNDLTDADLDNIYDKYRDLGIRGETIQESFFKLITAKNSERENHKRFEYFSSNFKNDLVNILDIGSGLGVFPEILRRNGYSVQCIEPNNDSRAFIKSIGIECFKELNELCGKHYDVISLVHVLEHIKEPVSYLNMLKNYLTPYGCLFVEVPHSKEFNYLPMMHDEFNSLHYFFYDLESISRMLHKAGFDVTQYSKIYYEARNLTRCVVIAERINHEIN